MERIQERWSYDVFLSFHGSDTRKNFTDHLYYALTDNGIHTFRDDVALPRGENIVLKLREAIETSRILIVVLSKNYASSPWCLEELLCIMNCCRCNSRQMVLPIFHDVHPSDIRRQIGTVAEAFLKHETRNPSNKVQSWRVALRDVANLSGWHLSDRYEAECIKEIAREILQKLDSSYLRVASYDVGIRSRLHHFFQLMSIGSDDVQVIGICGMGGLGKTTIAKAVYNELSHLFEGKSFLHNFREHFVTPEGKFHLQEQLLSDILKRSDTAVKGTINALKGRFRQKRVLVIIDDVEDLSQLNSTAIEVSWFGPGSRIIITTRNRHLLKQLGVERMYLPEELTGGESLELFSWHAFGKKQPPEEFSGLSGNIVEYCGGLPLAVEVLGAFLSKRTIREWKSTLALLKQQPDDKIQEKLRISFDGLSSVQKDIFLDVACFFIGMDKDYASYILDGCGLCPDIGLSVLMDRFLITVHDDKLMMHDLIRDMGRHIVREKSPKNCGKRSRVWEPDDAFDILTKYSGTEEVEGLSLNAQALDTKILDARAFLNLPELRLLQLGNVQIIGSYENFPKGLRWLCWHKFPLEIVPENFYLRALVVMDMQYSNLRRLWSAKGAQHLKKLKYLDLSHSFYLTETPDFSYLPNLEKILLVDCRSLVLIHSSIGILHEKLVFLNLNGCIRLEGLPSELYQLKSLETLILSGCLKLKKLDDALGGMEGLTTLLADHTAIKKVPSSIIRLKRLKSLSLCGCKRSWNNGYAHFGRSPLPVSLISLNSLKVLRLSYCSLSDELMNPYDIRSFPCLEELDLRGNDFQNLKTDFARFQNLLILRLDNCSKLQSIYSLPTSLKYLHAADCVSLERTPDLSGCSFLQALYLTNCVNLVEATGLDKLKTIRVIRMEMCKRISNSFKESLLQGWTVRGYGGIFLPGSRLPSWFSLKDETKSVSFTVPEAHNLDSVGMKLCASYTSNLNNVVSEYSPTITVKNHTKGSVRTCRTEELDVRMYREQHLCHGHLPNDDLDFEQGDRVEVEVDFGGQVTVLQTGVALVYEAKELYTESLCRPRIEYNHASNEHGIVSTEEGSIDETRDEQLKEKEAETMEDFSGVNDCGTEPWEKTIEDLSGK
ncbi:PREDICTED: TMV resistance protein N-like isoform X2 [Tarenaya hassleriana]|uniref:TMV resistance protein N-like isoform X2 n=1 Tax=Tarenaya hassleriana TaxID=28532 RepID=UPI00053C325C|nr:PREDICTED: TMV resistance protein N-like isoform X2 [Tarenaya hassleriana]